MGSSLSVKNISKGFGITKALVDVSLDIKPGEFVSLLGPSGCGKSTLLRIIAGLLNADHGDVALDDTSILGLRPNERNIAMVFQNYALYPHMTVYENMSFGLRLKKVDKAEIAQRVENAARILDITELLQRKPKQLSGGQRQRVAMGRAIVRDPKVFLFDEPFGALDEITRQNLNEEVGRLFKELDFGGLFITHSIPEAVFLSSRIVIMSARPGRIVEVIESTLPIDRTLDIRDTPEFVALAHRVRVALHVGHEQ